MRRRPGGLRAAPPEPLEGWVAPIRALALARRADLERLPDPEARWRALCEWNVMAQVRSLRSQAIVQDAWERGRKLALHGWIYDLRDGLLRDLEVSVDRP